MNFTCLILGILFASAGVFFYSGRAVNHITAWKKRNIRIGPLCRNVGTMIFISGIIFILSGLWKAFRGDVFLWSMIAWLILSGLDVYWIGKSGRYQIPE